MNDRNAAERAAAVQPPAPSAAGPVPKWRSVDADMQRIFGPGTSARQAMRLPSAAGPQVRPVPSRARRLAIPLAVLTCVAGAAAGLVVVAPLRHPTAAKPTRMLARAVPPSGVLPTAMTAMMPAAAGAPAMRSFWHRDAIPATPAPQTPGGTDGTALVQTQPAPTPAAFAQQDARIGCDDDDDACSRSDVLAADRDLRLAYLRAVDAGVDRDRLVSIRNRWARLRATEYDRPGELLAGYAELADRLDRAADDRGESLR